MLAYLFWHRPRRPLDAQDYERRLVAFHEKLAESGRSSAAFRLTRLPFSELCGYEDWYLVEDWAALGPRSATRSAGGDVTASPACDAPASRPRTTWAPTLGPIE